MIKMLPAETPPLNQVISETFVVAYKEECSALMKCLTESGLPPHLVRQQDSPEIEGYSQSIRVMLNHETVWKKIQTKEAGHYLICEADFIPVQNFGLLPCPFRLDKTPFGVTYLYVVGPQIYYVTYEGYARGRSVGMVAYIVTPQSASLLLEFTQELLKGHNPKEYLPFDSLLCDFMWKNKLQCHIACRNYGEHGGKPNPEHLQYGLSPTHRAEVLAGPLAFKPPYVTSQFHYICVRLHARTRDLIRIFLGRFLRPRVFTRANYRHRLLTFLIRRHLTLQL